jgi:MFS family permease
MMNRNFWVLTIGQTLNILGSNFGQMAQAVLVYDLTGSKLAMGTILLLSMGTETLLRLLGSPLIDRFNRVRLLRAMEGAQTLIYVVPPLLASVGLLQIWHLYLFAIVAGLIGALHAPAYFALVPSLVEPDQLVRANSLSQTLTSAAGLIGPALAGLLIAAVGPVPALCIDVASYAVSALGLLLLPASLGEVKRQPVQTGASYVGQLVEGVRFYRTVPLLVLALAGAAAINLSLAASNAMLLPLVQERLGMDVAAVGALSSSLSAGIMLGGLVMGWIGQVKRRILALMTPLFASGLAVMALALLGRGQLLLALAAYGVLGLGIGLYVPQTGALYQQLVPDELRGRVMSVRLTVAWGALPLGAALGAVVADWAGLGAMLVGFGLVPVLIAAYALLSRAGAQTETAPAPAPVKRKTRSAA